MTRLDPNNPRPDFALMRDAMRELVTVNSRAGQALGALDMARRLLARFAERERAARQRSTEYTARGEVPPAAHWDGTATTYHEAAALVMDALKDILKEGNPDADA